MSLRRGTSIKLGDNAASFFSFAQATTLTPNLTKLTVFTTGVDAQEYTHWVKAFLSPALLSLELAYDSEDSNHRDLDSTLAAGLLEHISPRCSKLQALEFFPEEVVDDYESEFSETKSTAADIKRLNMLASLRVQISSFRNLRELKSRVLVLRPSVLSALGDLPHLETLSIYGGQEPRIFGLTLPDSSFPALRNLELLGFHWSNLRYMCDLTPLLHQLTRLVLELSIRDYWWDADIGEAEWPTNIMLSVSEHAPLLTDLSMNFITVNTCVLVDSDWVDALENLPLKRLNLQYTEFDCGWTNLASALPDLEEFRATSISSKAVRMMRRRLPQLVVDTAEYSEEEDGVEDEDEDEDEDGVEDEDEDEDGDEEEDE